MKKFLFGCTIALTGLTMPQAFAEYCCPPPCAPCEPVCCAADFSGFYVGGNIGVYTNVHHFNDFDNFVSTNIGPTGVIATNTSSHTSFTAGVQAGYDWDCCNKLIGIVGDWNWVNNERRNNSAFTFAQHRHRNNWIATIRARAGVTLCDALFYVTLGAAVHDRHHRFTDVTGINTGHHRHTKWGWAGGVGTEFMCGCNWSIGVEFLVLNFDNTNRRFTVGTTPFFITCSNTSYLGRVLLNWRLGNLFGGGGGGGIF